MRGAVTAAVEWRLAAVVPAWKLVVSRKIGGSRAGGFGGGNG